jgi:hypothetical protein
LLAQQDKADQHFPLRSVGEAGPNKFLGAAYVDYGSESGIIKPAPTHFVVGRTMRRIYLGVIFVAILAGSLASMIAIQRVVSTIAKPDVLPEGDTARSIHDSKGITPKI